MINEKFKEWYEKSWLGKKDDKYECKNYKKESIYADYASRYNTNKLNAGKKILDDIKRRNLQRMKEEFANPRPPKTESDEDKVVRILKTDFEAKHGMTFDKFIEVYNKILKDSPEKLI